MKKLPQIALLIAAMAIGSAGIATDALARGGGGGHGGSGGHSGAGSHSTGAGSHSNSVSSGSTSMSTDQTEDQSDRRGGHDDWNDSSPYRY